MNTNGGLSPDKLASMGRALYGERWQTSLATDLGVADRTMRRWLVGESPIPDGVESELRKLLIQRVGEIGGMIGYSVNASERTVFHYPTYANFSYDDAGNLTLLSSGFATPDKISLITKGAEEALQQEGEGDPRSKFSWLNLMGRR